jgi:RimJ/RimL family protein N-acetyltransferase
MYLMADLGYRRYEWRCNAPNERSRRAALRLGFSFKSTFRLHMMQKGGIATPQCSITNGSAQGALRESLAPENFDANGWQRVSLSLLS